MRLLLERGVGYVVSESLILFGLMRLANFAFGVPWPAVFPHEPEPLPA